MSEDAKVSRLEALGYWDEADELRTRIDQRAGDIRRNALEDYAAFLKRQKRKKQNKIKSPQK